MDTLIYGYMDKVLDIYRRWYHSPGGVEGGTVMTGGGGTLFGLYA